MLGKKELIREISDKTGFTLTDSELFLDATLETIASNVKLGVRLPGVGILRTRVRGARVGRNPITGESVQVKAKRVPSFRPATGLKEAAL